MAHRKKGYLLLELLISVTILVTSGLVIFQTFSKEIELSALTSDLQSAAHLCQLKLFDMEFDIRQTNSIEAWDTIKSTSAPISDQSTFSWKGEASQLPDLPSLVELRMTLSGLKGNRGLHLYKWLSLPVSEEE